MHHFSTWKKATILLVCLAACMIALPNLLSDEEVAALPDWMPRDKVNLGLDLRGGSHLLYQLDLERYFAEQYEAYKNDMRTRMREARIGYRELTSYPDSVQFSLRGENVTVEAVSEIVQEMDSDLAVTQEDGTIVIRYPEDVQIEKQQDLLEQSIEIINRRVNETGTKEPLIQRQGDQRILVQVPGLDDPARLKEIIGKTAKMTFHLVNENITEQQLLRGVMPTGTRVLKMERDNGPAAQQFRIPIYTKVELTGEWLTGANATYSEGQPVVAFSFNSIGAKKFGDITKKHQGKRFAVVLDGKVITAPTMRVPILDGSGIIEGGFTVETANDLAVLLRAGALPAPLEIIEERSVGPSLGADSIAAGEMAVVIAFAGIMVFMILYYGLFGLFSDIALLMNVVLIMAVLSLFQSTLTLPGIAGIVLTMGMAVDANTLIFERIREEMHKGKSVLASIDHGFKTAFDTIMDANITTLIAAFILFYFGSGTVKGFAVTLSIGILASMFSAIMLTRFFIMAWVGYARPRKLPL